MEMFSIFAFHFIASGHLFDNDVDDDGSGRCVNIFHVKFSLLCVGRLEQCARNSGPRRHRGPFIIDYLRRFFMFQFFASLFPESSQRSNHTISTKTTSKWTGHFSKWPSLYDPRKFRCTDRTGKMCNMPVNI